MPGEAAHKEQYAANAGDLNAIESMLNSQTGIGHINFQKETLEAIDNCCGGACITDKNVYAKKHGASYANDNVRVQTEVPHEVIESSGISFDSSENIADRVQYTDSSAQESTKSGTNVYFIDHLQKRDQKADTKAAYVPATAQSDKAADTQAYQNESKAQAYDNKTVASYTTITDKKVIAIKDGSLGSPSAQAYQATDSAVQKEHISYSSTVFEQRIVKEQLIEKYQQNDRAVEHSPAVTLQKNAPPYDALVASETKTAHNVIPVDFGSRQRDSQTLDLFLQKYASQFSGIEMAQTSNIIDFSPQKANDKYVNSAVRTVLLESKVDASIYAASNSMHQVMQSNTLTETNLAKESAVASSEKLELLIQKAANDNYRPKQTASAPQEKYQRKTEEKMQGQQEKYSGKRAISLEQNVGAEKQYSNKKSTNLEQNGGTSKEYANKKESAPEKNARVSREQYAAAKNADFATHAAKEGQQKGNYANAKSHEWERRGDAALVAYNKESQNVASSLAQFHSIDKKEQNPSNYAKYGGYENSLYSKKRISGLYPKHEETSRKSASKKSEEEELMDKKTRDNKPSKPKKPETKPIKEFQSKRKLKLKVKGDKNGSNTKTNRLKRNRAKDARDKRASKVVSKRLKR